LPERRLAHRLEVHLSVRYSSDSVTLSGIASSLSRNGMFLRTDYLDSRGQSAAVTVTLPGHPAPLELSGEVVRVDEEPSRAGMAIRFGDLAPSSRKRLAEFVIEHGYLALQ
jgi:uncharacterized protein (TIGR02266 family)